MRTFFGQPQRRLGTGQIWLAVFLLIYSAASADEDKFLKAYTISGDTQAIFETAKAVVGDRGNVLYDRTTSRLLVYATPAAHSDLTSVLGNTVVLPKNVRLEVVFNEAAEVEERKFGVSGSGKVEVKPGSVNAKVRISPEIKDNTSRTTSLNRHLLMLRSGAEGLLMVGREVPFIEPLLVFGRNWGYIQPEIQIRNIGAALRVQATVIGDGPMIQVRLTPELSGLVSNKIETIRFTKVATEVIVQDGSTVTIGSFKENQDFYDKFLAGASRSRRSGNTTITLTAGINTLKGP